MLIPQRHTTTAPAHRQSTPTYSPLLRNVLSSRASVMSLQHVSSRIGIARGDRRALRRRKTRRPRPLRRATHRSAAPTFRAHGSSVPRRRLQVCHRNAAYYPWLAGVVAPRTTVARPQALNTPCANSGRARRVDGGVGLAACYPPGGWAAGRLGGWAARRLGGWAAGRLGGWAARLRTSATRRRRMRC
jgi:hypothetical protein